MFRAYLQYFCLSKGFSLTPFRSAIDECMCRILLYGTDAYPGGRQVDADPRIVVEGHEAELDEVAAHAELPYQFATACKSGKVHSVQVHARVDTNSSVTNSHWFRCSNLKSLHQSVSLFLRTWLSPRATPPPTPTPVPRVGRPAARRSHVRRPGVRAQGHSLQPGGAASKGGEVARLPNGRYMRCALRACTTRTPPTLVALERPVPVSFPCYQLPVPLRELKQKAVHDYSGSTF